MLWAMLAVKNRLCLPMDCNRRDMKAILDLTLRYSPVSPLLTPYVCVSARVCVCMRVLSRMVDKKREEGRKTAHTNAHLER